MIQIRQQISSKDLDPSTSNFPSMPFTSFADHSNNDDQHVHNRTLHSMELLDYYLNIKQQTRMEPLHLRSGYDVELICQTNGSWPLATIEWKLRDFRTNIEKDITHLRLVLIYNHSHSIVLSICNRLYSCVCVCLYNNRLQINVYISHDLF